MMSVYECWRDRRLATSSWYWWVESDDRSLVDGSSCVMSVYECWRDWKVSTSRWYWWVESDDWSPTSRVEFMLRSMYPALLSRILSTLVLTPENVGLSSGLPAQHSFSTEYLYGVTNNHNYIVYFAKDIHFLRADRWFGQSMTILQILNNGEHIHSWVRSVAKCEDLPASHSISPLERTSRKA